MQKLESSSGSTGSGDHGVPGKEESKREMRKGEREIGERREKGKKGLGQYLQISLFLNSVIC